MRAAGIIVKMPVSVAPDGTVGYTLRLEGPRDGEGTDPSGLETVPLADLIGRGVRLEHSGEYRCVRCGRKTNRTFGEGFCFPCFRDAPEAAECIVKPELCEAHLGRGRDPAWEEAHHNQPHAVYFAVSSALKVGVTRMTQVPTRWVDQGAAWAAIIAETPYRQIAGRIEVALKELYTDRTAWQKMLKDEPPAEAIDLPTELARVAARIGEVEPELSQYLVPSDRVVPRRLLYPLSQPPVKVKAVNLAKAGFVESTLIGARGQYLVFDGGAVFNVRRHSGFVVTISA